MTKKSAQKLTTDVLQSILSTTILQMRSNAYRDYVAARVLLDNQLWIQGLVMTSTCIEKYLKCILLTAGKKSKVHLDSPDFLTVLKLNNRDVSSFISESFIRYLGRAYVLRYIEPTSHQASIAIEPKKLLAELDYTVAQIEASIVISTSTKEQLDNGYQDAVKNRDDRIFKNNHILNNIDKNIFVEEYNMLFILTIEPRLGPIAIRHGKYLSCNNQNFDYPTAKFISSTEITIEFNPAENSINLAQRFI